MKPLSGCAKSPDNAATGNTPRSGTAIAHTDSDLFVLSLAQFKQLAADHKKLALLLITAISRTLEQRLRHADGE